VNRAATLAPRGVQQARAIARLAALSAWAAVEGFVRDDDLTYAASIAYYGLLSLFPFYLLAFAVLGHITTNQAARNTVLTVVLQYFPTQFDFIREQLDAFNTNTTTFGLVGTIALLWGALGVFGAISTAVNYAWGVKTLRSYWKHKLFSFVMLVLAGMVLLMALLLASASGVVDTSWFADVLREFPGLSFLHGLAIRYATTPLFIVVVGLIYMYVPNTKVHFQDVWIGAVVTGLIWKAVLSGLAWFMSDMSRFTRVDGSISAVVVFLVWVYVQAAIMLYGVEFTAAYCRLRTETTKITEA
jgi:membrane protein